jgi:septal ring factor EnvC (AmiA/AmiB activator)
MGAPVLDFPRQSLVKVGFKPDQAEVLLRLMDLKMQNVLTQEYLDLALGRFADQVKSDISAVRQEIADLRTETKQEIAELRTEVKDLKRELKDDIKDVRNEMKDMRQELRLEISERHNKQLIWMAGIIGMALAAARLLFSF